jgi:glucose/arabinose dehydrogenase/PKD repeat protein
VTPASHPVNLRLPGLSPLRQARWPIVLAALAGLAAVGSGSHPGGAQRTAATSVGGFVSDAVFDNLPSPMDFAFAPDGRIFVADKNGSVYIIKDGDLLSTPFITLAVNTYWDRGLQSIALDPNFEATGYVYLYYTYENDPADVTGPKTGRLIRVTANGDVADPESELVLLGTAVGDADHPSCQDLATGADCLPADGVSHVGGGLSFAPDGTLLFATGDAAYFAYFPIVPALESRAQDLDSLAGKLLRINPADGTAPADNPFFTGEPTDNRSKVFSYGFRNPFRIALDPATGTWLIGDVGSAYWEEINVAQAGADFGWPCYEGTAEHPDQNTFASCQALYASGTPNTHPLYSYAGPGAAVVAGAFYHGANYPSDLAGGFFFGDWVRNTISFLPADPDTGQLLPDRAQQLFAGAGASVDFKAGPDGDIYYLAWSGSGLGQLRHIRFVEGDRPPVAQASASPGGGLAPLSVQFSSAASSDPDGDEISFAWDFGDGGTSVEANPIHEYSENSAYQAQLTVSDEEHVTSSTTVTVVVGNQPPVATINAPGPNSAYQDGQAVAFSGSGHDPETGALAGSRLHWTVVLHHCYLATHSCHTHPFLNLTGAGGTLIAPLQGEAGEFPYLALQLTATDSAGLSNTASIEIGPDSDGDGLPDERELLSTGTDYLNPDTDGDGCTDGQEMGQSEFTGGGRDPLNPWDYFDPNHDGMVRIDDIVAVVMQYYKDKYLDPPTNSVPNPSYTEQTDRSGPIGPNAWNLGPPDGEQQIDDIADEVAQYYHDCT